MRRNTFVVICGGAALLALFVVILCGPQQRTAERAKALPALGGPGPAPEPKSIVPQKQLDWAQVESKDYRTFIKNLRDGGCPEQTVRDIVITEMNRLFDSKERDAALTNHVEYWKTGSVLPREVVKARLSEQHERFELERLAILKELLGDGTDIEHRSAKVSDADLKFNLLDFMPVEERPKALKAINEIDATYGTRVRSPDRCRLVGQ